MKRGRRWLAVAVVAVALVAAPYLVQARPVGDPGMSPTEVAAAVARSGDVAHTGLVVSDGAVQVPETDSFEGLTTLFGERNRVRVWWRDDDRWRLDRIRATGETDLLRGPRGTLRWVYESGNVTVFSPAPVRLPDTSDVMPGTLARRVLAGARADELSSLPARRVAGREAAGVRLRPSDPQATIDRVDVWADARTGVPLEVRVWSGDGPRPALASHYERLRLKEPPASATSFAPPPGSDVRFDDTLDVTSSADAYAPWRAPDRLAGLGPRPDRPDLPTRAVGVYGRGPTVLLFVPLRGRAAEPLRDQLRTSPGAREDGAGVHADLGPISVLVTPGRYRGSGFVLAGTVTPETLDRAADELIDLRPVFE